MLLFYRCNGVLVIKTKTYSYAWQRSIPVLRFQRLSPEGSTLPFFTYYYLFLSPQFPFFYLVIGFNTRQQKVHQYSNTPEPSKYEGFIHDESGIASPAWIPQRPPCPSQHFSNSIVSWEKRSSFPGVFLTGACQFTCYLLLRQQMVRQQGGTYVQKVHGIGSAYVWKWESAIKMKKWRRGLILGNLIRWVLMLCKPTPTSSIKRLFILTRFTMFLYDYCQHFPANEYVKNDWDILAPILSK